MRNVHGFMRPLPLVLLGLLAGHAAAPAVPRARAAPAMPRARAAPAMPRARAAPALPRARAAPAMPRARATPAAQFSPVVAGAGNQLGPSACMLSTGVRLLAFERLQTAMARRVYLKRKRPSFPWSYGKEVPLPKGRYSMQSASLLCRPRDEVLLYAQAGDLRRRAAQIWLFPGQGDSLALGAGRPLDLGLARGGAVTDPFASPGPRGQGVLLTVSVRFSGDTDGCYLARSADGLGFPRGALRLGPGERCRVVALDQTRLLLTYHSRQSLRQPMQAYFRLSPDDGAHWSAQTKVASLALESSEPHPLATTGGAASIFHVARLAGRWAVFVTRIDPSGRAAPSARLTPLQTNRVLGPGTLGAGATTELIWAREVRPLDFDIVSMPLSR